MTHNLLCYVWCTLSNKAILLKCSAVHYKWGVDIKERCESWGRGVAEETWKGMPPPLLTSVLLITVLENLLSSSQFICQLNLLSDYTWYIWQDKESLNYRFFLSLVKQSSCFDFPNKAKGHIISICFKLTIKTDPIQVLIKTQQNLDNIGQTAKCSKIFQACCAPSLNWHQLDGGGWSSGSPSEHFFKFYPECPIAQSSKI